MIAQSPAAQGVRIDSRLSRVFRLRKGVMTTARLVNDRLKSAPIRWVPVMVTLTYRDVDAWRKNHIADFIKRVYMYGRRRGYKLPYLWVMELQKRGAPHYHVIFWIPARLRLPKADRQGWWLHGSTNIVRVKNAVGYVAKYASKMESKDDGEFPRGARIHGSGGLEKHEKRIVAWWKLPKDLRTGEEGSVAWCRAPGGGWLNRDTGELRSPDWGLSAIGDKTVVLCRITSAAAHGRAVRATEQAAQRSGHLEAVMWANLAENIARSQRYAEAVATVRRWFEDPESTSPGAYLSALRKVGTADLHV